jgi:hypothetical protein
MYWKFTDNQYARKDVNQSLASMRIRRKQVKVMYATMENGRIIHLIARGGGYTLCGLRIPRGRRKEETDDISKALCKHCERINKSSSD